VVENANEEFRLIENVQNLKLSPRKSRDDFNFHISYPPTVSLFFSEQFRVHSWLLFLIKPFFVFIYIYLFRRR